MPGFLINADWIQILAEFKADRYQLTNLDDIREIIDGHSHIDDALPELTHIAPYVYTIFLRLLSKQTELDCFMNTC